MAKKSRYSKNHAHSNKENIVRPASFKNDKWHPLDKEIDGRRDQRYVKNIKPRSQGQEILIQSIKERSLTLAIGPAGTGKTYLAIASAVEALENGEIERIVLSRPAMEAGESLGFLPGDLQEKMAPYLRPLYDSLGDRLGGKKVRQYLEDGTIEIAPIGFMRGRTLNNAFIVIDEAQNCTYGQLKMILSRLGWHSTMVITGDPDQSDLLDGISGLSQISDRLESIENIAVCRLEKQDIVRHPLVAKMLDVL
ncbi:MAG: phosphate starvation-inducible protein PhoH [Zetaproteobacteria bacterium]|nr:MAG: phosphate starvation-inducible protein PhoH [Zetaproteobacteria bacterium]